MKPLRNSNFYRVAKAIVRGLDTDQMEIEAAWRNSRCMIQVFNHFKFSQGSGKITKTHWHLAVAFLFQDECHGEKGPHSRMMGTVLKHRFWDDPQNANVSFNPMSGNLLVGGMSDFAQFFDKMPRFSESRWKDNPRFPAWMDGKAIAEGKTWESLLKRHKATDEDRETHVNVSLCDSMWIWTF